MARASLRATCQTWLAACLLLAACAHGQVSGSDAGAQNAHPTRFVDANVLELEKRIPVPPASGSLAELADLESVLQVQVRRTSTDVTWARAVPELDVFASSDIVGPWFTQKNLPHVAEFFGKIKQDAAAATDRAKKLYRRERPYTLSAEVTPCVDRSATYSYPSGYAVQVFVRAGVLAELFPEQRAELLAQAREFAWARIVGGAHYPSDDVAGRLLAELLVAELRKSVPFRAALEQARSEIQARAVK